MALLDNLKGSIEINIPKASFTRGETIQGTVLLKIRSPVEARGAKISFQCLEEYSSGKHRRTITLYQDEKELSSKSVFNHDEQFSFQFTVPPEVGMKKDSGFFNAAIDFLQRKRVYWVIFAKLDLPMSLDISQKKFLNII